MESRRTLLIAAIFALQVIAGPMATAAEDSTPPAPPATATNSGSSTSLFGTQQNTGSGKTDDPPSDPSTESPSTPTTPVIDDGLATRQRLYDSAIANNRYVYRYLDGVNCITPSTPIPETPPPPGQPAQPTVTIRDLATFIPAATTLTMEPAHWILRDSPTNFIAHAEQQVVTAPLLGQQADVRFTPIGYTFDYGDGTTRTTDTGGDTWANLGLDEFSETETSHVYTKRGYYDITASAVYVAEYRIGGGAWNSVTGTIAIPTTHTGRTVTIDTVLVRGTCDEYPEDPGCPGWDPGPLED